MLPAIGWWGVANLGHEFLLPLAVVLRSWEDRFGACLIDVGFAEIRLLVERPPRPLAAERIAAEHYVLADRSGEGLQAVSRIAASLVNAPIWAFWWTDQGARITGLGPGTPYGGTPPRRP